MRNHLALLRDRQGTAPSPVQGPRPQAVEQQTGHRLAGHRNLAFITLDQQLLLGAPSTSKTHPYGRSRRWDVVPEAAPRARVGARTSLEAPPAFRDRVPVPLKRSGTVRKVRVEVVASGEERASSLRPTGRGLPPARARCCCRASATTCRQQHAYTSTHKARLANRPTAACWIGLPLTSNVGINSHSELHRNPDNASKRMTTGMLDPMTLALTQFYSCRQRATRNQRNEFLCIQSKMIAK